MKKSTLTASVALAATMAFATTSLSAQAQTRPPAKGQAEVLYAISPADMVAILDDLGLAHEYLGDSTNDFLVTTSNGFKFGVFLTVCDLPDQPLGCLGIELLASWGVDAGKEDLAAKKANDFNATMSLVKTYSIDGDGIYMQRYVILDQGVTSDHINDQISEFLGMSVNFAEAINEATGMTLNGGM
jgi:hypothetical protein